MSRLEIPVERHTLANGLNVVLSVDRTVPIVAVNLWYAVGSRNEQPGKTGFAHLFEHMMFQGSQHVPKNGHFEMIERAGGSMNGSTWFDRTNYYETVPSHQLDLALWLESDRLGWMLPAMTQEKLDNQRDVVKNEKRQSYDNRPYGDWSERMQALLFPEGHPYRHTVIGSMEDLDAASLEDVAEFFRTWYVPDNCVLTICGDIDPEHALGRARAWFETIERGGDRPPVTGDEDLAPTLGHTVTERVVSQVPLVRVMTGARVPSCLTEEHDAVSLGAAILGSGRASRLYRSLVREKRVAKDAGSFAYPLVGRSSMMLCWATGYPGTDPEALESALFDEMDALRDVSDGELARAVTMTEAEVVRSLEQVAERADRISRYTTFFDDPGRVNSEVERLRSVTRDQVAEVVGRYFGRDNRAVLTYVPEEES